MLNTKLSSNKKSISTLEERLVNTLGERTIEGGALDYADLHYNATGARLNSDNVSITPSWKERTIRD